MNHVYFKYDQYSISFLGVNKGEKSVSDDFNDSFSSYLTFTFVTFFIMKNELNKIKYGMLDLFSYIYEKIGNDFTCCDDPNYPVTTL